MDISTFDHFIRDYVCHQNISSFVNCSDTNLEINDKSGDVIVLNEIISKFKNLEDEFLKIRVKINYVRDIVRLLQIFCVPLSKFEELLEHIEKIDDFFQFKKALSGKLYIDCRKKLVQFCNVILQTPKLKAMEQYREEHIEVNMNFIEHCTKDIKYETLANEQAIQEDGILYLTHVSPPINESTNNENGHKCTFFNKRKELEDIAEIGDDFLTTLSASIVYNPSNSGETSENKPPIRSILNNTKSYKRGYAGAWTFEDEELLIQLVKAHGKTWAKFLDRFPKRTNINLKDKFRLLERHGRTL